jgi:hypothetical protein
MPANYVLIERFTVSVEVSSIVIDNIPQTGYTDLKLVLSSQKGTGSGNAYGLRFNNGAGGSDYVAKVLRGTGSVSSYTQTAPQMFESKMPSTTDGAYFSYDEILIPKYNVAGFNKTAHLDNTFDINTANYDTYLSVQDGRWTGTAAINSITIQPTSAWNFAQYTNVELYGLAGEGVTPTNIPKATGGDIITNDGTYWYHAFLASGTFTPLSNLSCDYLVVAGGGGGGSNFGGGGGGAGGLRAFTAQTLSLNTLYPAVVGSGGAAANSNTAYGGTGNGSSFNGSTSAGGGGAGSYDTSWNVGRAGGSGGGGGGGLASGAGGAGNTPSTSPSQGNNGGTAFYDATQTNRSGGGGGGAGAVGSNAGSNNGGAGGAGSNTYSTWATATSTGASGFYAGGGGGASGSGGGGGGTGGGGRGSLNSSYAADNGTVNTGGGGGGGSNVYFSGANGGSGIVIVRYTMA